MNLTLGINRSLFVIISSCMFLLGNFPAYGGVFFQDGFESGDLSHTENGVKWTSVAWGGVNSVKPKSGAHSMEFHFNSARDGVDSFSELRFNLGGNYKDLWVAYDLYIPDNYYHRKQSTSDNNKGFLYLWSGNYGNTTGPGLGPNFWPLNNGGSYASMYSWNTASPSFGKHYWNACPTAIDINDAGKWVRITAHYKYASAANNDGIAQIWKTYADGTRQLICNETKGKWYVPGAPGFDQGYILGWANSGFTDATLFYLDNVIFSDTSLLQGIVAPPNPPVPQ